MKRSLTVLGLGIALLVQTIPSYAQTTTASTSTNEAATEKRADDNVSSDRVAARATALTEKTQKRITNLAANLSNRIEAVINRLTNIATRLESRADKLEANGVDTSEARSYLQTARTSLAEAQTLMSSIDRQVAVVIGSTNPRAEWQSLKTTYTQARDLIRATHADLRVVVQLLKNPPNNTSDAEETN